MNKLLKTATITASALAFGLAFAASAVAAPRNHGGHQSAGQHGSSHAASRGHRGAGNGNSGRHAFSGGHGNSHRSGHNFTSRHGGHGGHHVGATLAYAVGFGIVSSIAYSNSYAQNVSYQAGYDSHGSSCHPVTKLGYDAYGRRARIGGTMCYDSYGQSYIVAGSRYVIDYY